VQCKCASVQVQPTFFPINPISIPVPVPVPVPVHIDLLFCSHN
jgi:hypothetical protein